MPFDIKPIVDTTPGAGSFDLDPGGVWSWLGKQDYQPVRAEAALSYHTHGALLGGPTYQQLLSEEDPHKFTVMATPPPLTTAVLQGYNNALGGRKIGQLSLDLIDPFGSMGQATGSFFGSDKPAVGPGGGLDPGAFLAAKSMDIFGRDDVGIPARLTDYALALPNLILRKMHGDNLLAEPSSSDPSGVLYRFQADPNYWQLLNVATTDDALRAIANTVASRYLDPSRNGYLVKQLFGQMKSDRDTRVTAMSSGNARIDYMAKWRLTSDLINVAYPGSIQGPAGMPNVLPASDAVTIAHLAGLSADIVSAIPFVGPQIAAGLAPIDPRIEAAWAGLTREQRANYLGNAQLGAAGTDMAVMLPLLSGMGSILAVAKGAKGIAGTLYTAYDTTLRASALMMGAGVVVATENWAFEAMSPAYSELLGKEIDYARPISKSSLAGVVNELGFWSSGTFGVMPAVQLVGRAARIAGRGAEVAAGFGAHELTFFQVYGGSWLRRDLEAAGLTGIDTSIKASFLSHTLNYIERTRRDVLEAFVRGERTGRSDLDAMDPQARLNYSNDQLARGMEDGPPIAEGFIRMLGWGAKPAPINPSEKVRETFAFVKNFRRTFDEILGADVAAQYGPQFIASKRVVGRYDGPAMEAWSRAKVTELGGDGKLLGKRSDDAWAQTVRTLHQHEYHRLNGELHAALEEEASAEAGRLAIIASDHLFAQDVDVLLAELERGDRASNAATIASAIESSREAADWFTHHFTAKTGLRKAPENVPPEVFKRWLEDVRPALPNRRLNAQPGADTALRPVNMLQAKLDAQGTWTLAFKPVDDNGDFVSYARTRSGGLLRSPWVEYPMTAPDNLDLGNRGWLVSKLDSMTRAFRTRNLTEFQRANLFRMLSGKFDVLPEQIDALNEGILTLAREIRLPPQTIGALAKLPDTVAFANKTKDELEALVHKIFGEGDLRGRDGRPIKIDWPTLVAKAYRQSFRLNATAGLTSYLKTMGPVGAAASIISDWAYIMWRFRVSPIFLGGEVLESDVLNPMRGVFRGDPLTEATFVRGGVGNDGSFLRSELGYDAVLQAMTTRADVTPSQRLAASVSLHARHLPEDLQLARETASVQGIAANRPFRPAEGLDPSRLQDEWQWAPAKAQSMIDHSEMVPTSLLEPLREIDRRANPEPSLHGSIDELGADMEGNGIQAPIIVWWDPASGRAVVADGNHRLTLALERGIEELPTVVEARSPEEVGQALHVGQLAQPKQNVQVPPDGILRPSDVFGEADAALPLPPLATDQEGLLRQLRQTFAKEPPPTPYARPAYTEEGGLHRELNDLIGENGVFPGLEPRAKEILDRLDEIARTKGDEGPVFSFWDLSRQQQETVAKRIADEGYVFHGSSESPNVPAPRITSEAGFFTTTSFTDAGWYAARFGDGGWVRGRPPGTVYVAKLPREVLDLSAPSPEQINRLSEAMTADLGDLRARYDDGLALADSKDPSVLREARIAAHAYIASVDNWVGRYHGAAEPAAYNVAVSRSRFLRAQRGESGWDVAYLNELADRLGVDAIKVKEPPMVDHRGEPIDVWIFREKPTTVPIDEVYAQSQRRPGTADSIGDIAGTPEAFEEVLATWAEDQAKHGLTAAVRHAASTVWHPAAHKQSRALSLQIDLIERSFPGMLRASGNHGLVKVFEDLGIREDRWARWLLEDRKLLDDWLALKADPEAAAPALDALLAHAGDSPAERAAMNELYASPEWETLTSLWSINLAATRDEAFGVHFFSPYRSAFERTINHPVLGIYPASWAFKAAREWARFLFDNRTFGALRLGMAPAQAISEMARSQAAAFAQTNDDTLAHFLQKGPLGSTIFIFNLLMPGDWSSLPFPLSRTIREVLRGNTDPAALLKANLDYLGLTRDLRLMGESAGELYNLVVHPKKEPVAQQLKGISAHGVEDQFGPDSYH